jgi:hypothetical protein
LLAVGRQNLIKTDDTRLQKLLKLSNFYWSVLHNLALFDGSGSYPCHFLISYVDYRWQSQLNIYLESL